ncbi:MAG TPA: hypothetical protein VNX29_04565 [Kaistia sp.]|nr:hypothetical protein [Kaistia sp.]
MPATITTRQIKDGANNLIDRQLLDVAGTGYGPFIALQAIANAAGTGIVDIEALLAAGIPLFAGAAVVSATNPLPVGGSQLATVTATIASGGSLSGAVDLGTGRLVGLILPAAWTTAAITFQGSADGATYFDLYDDATERAIASASVVPSRFIALPIVDWLMIRSVKLRSGSAATPVAQGAARSITLVTAR